MYSVNKSSVWTWLGAPFALALAVLSPQQGLAEADSDDWTVPLYLWAAADGSGHTALLPEAPSSYVGGLSDANYTLVRTAPLAFAHVPLAEPSYPLVSLKLYWSEGRGDLQTTTWSQAQLNAHGGAYAFVTDLGCLASTPGSGTGAHGFVPLTVSFDDGTGDAATAPLNFADLNALLPPAAGSAQYRPITGFSAITGFAATNAPASAATITGTKQSGGGGADDDCGELCSVSMSETFPSAGGADCAFPCGAGTSSFALTYDIGTIDSPEAASFSAAMSTAGAVLLDFGDATVKAFLLARRSF